MKYSLLWEHTISIGFSAQFGGSLISVLYQIQKYCVDTSLLKSNCLLLFVFVCVLLILYIAHAYYWQFGNDNMPVIS